MTNLPQTSLEKGLGKFWKIFCWNFSDLEQNDVELFIKSSHHVCQNYILRVWKMFWCWFLLIFRWVLSYFAKKIYFETSDKNLPACRSMLESACLLELHEEAHYFEKNIYFSYSYFSKIEQKTPVFSGKKIVLSVVKASIIWTRRNCGIFWTKLKIYTFFQSKYS